MVVVVGVTRARTTGAAMTKSGRKSYRGERKHWYVYFYDDEGHFRKKKINVLEVPYYGSLIRRRKTYLCQSCGTKYRAWEPPCPACGKKGVRLQRGRAERKGSGSAISRKREVHTGIGQPSEETLPPLQRLDDIE